MHRIVILFTLLSILCSANAIRLTYPIKGAYLGWRATVWSEPGSVINAAADAGYNLLIVTFYSNKSNDLLDAWDGMGQNKQSYIDYAHSKQTAILMGVWIQKEFGNLINVDNATDLGIKLASQVILRGFDGIDITIRETNPGFGIGSKNSNDSITWVADLTTAIRNTLGPDSIITFSPTALDFGPLNGPLGGFMSIHPRISHLIQHYNVFYWDGGTNCFVDYNSMFVHSPSSCPSTSVHEISISANINVSQLVVAKPILQSYSNSGYMTASELQTTFSNASSSLGWNTGVVGWTWSNTDETSTLWVNSIYPPALPTEAPTIVPTATSLTSSTAVSSTTDTAPSTSTSSSSSSSSSPTTTTTSTSTTTSTTVSSSSSSSSSSSTSSSVTTFLLSSSTSSSTNSDGFPIVNVCGLNSVPNAAGKCKCKSGYFKSGGSCRKTSIVVVAVIIPIIAVPAIIVILIFWWRSRTERRVVAPQRLPARSMSLPELESNYESTNLVTDFDAIVIKSRLGQGGSGVVNMGIWRHIEVAVKEFSNQDIQTTDFIRESEIHAKLRHPNVVQLLAICLPPHMCTISEFMAKGSLADVLQQKPTAFTWKRKLHALHDIAKGMDYLHKSKIIHRDLKSQNCLIDKNWNCKIADFGTSKLVGEANQTATAYVPRTAQWSAPEVIVRGEYSERSDVYSYGVIMWECLTGQIPYDGMFAFQVEDRTVKGSRLTVPVGCEAWFEGLMKACWAEDINERPTFEGIISCVEKAV